MLEKLKEFYIDIIKTHMKNDKNFIMELAFLESPEWKSFLFSTSNSLYYELLNQKKYDLAFKVVEEAYKIKPLTVIENLADLYRNGYGVEKDIIKAISLYEESYNNKSKSAAYELGKIYLEIDPLKAVEWFEKGTHTMNATYGGMCRYELGMLNYEGKLIEKNLKEAFEQFRWGSFYSDSRCTKLMYECFQALLIEYQKKGCIYFEISGYYDIDIFNKLNKKPIHMIKDDKKKNAMGISYVISYFGLSELYDENINSINNTLKPIIDNLKTLNILKYINGLEFTLNIYLKPDLYNTFKLDTDISASLNKIGCFINIISNNESADYLKLEKYMQANYELGKAILIEDLEKEFSKEFLNLNIPILINLERIKKYSEDVYYIPDSLIIDYEFSHFDNNSIGANDHTIDFRDVIKRRYVEEDGKKIGYLRMFVFGSFEIDELKNNVIYTNKDVNEKTITLGAFNFIVRKSKCEINDSNYKYLYVLDLLDSNDKANTINNLGIIKNLIKDLNYDYLVELSKNYEGIEEIIEMLRS